MQVSGVWLPLLLLCLFLLLPTSKGQNTTQSLNNQTCRCPHSDGDKNANCTSRCEEKNHTLSVGTIVGITLGVVMLLTGVIMGIVLVIHRKQKWHNPEPGPWKPSESSGSSSSAWQPRYGSRNSEQLSVATSPGLSVAPSPSNPRALLYENVFLGSEPGTQSPDPSQTRGALQDAEDLYMNYEDSSGAEHPIYGNVDNVTSLPDRQAAPEAGEDYEDDYVMPGC
ncbi:leucine-rich repeat-containing protein 25 isoform X2 [Macrotis lagotis]|uniref:leucine-rich repeat-containing protein 25 isoform X2 n=1 Tax=Macrotis lagotis TaxID=92651 RepID=UPI003D68CD9A